MIKVREPPCTTQVDSQPITLVDRVKIQVAGNTHNFNVIFHTIGQNSLLKSSLQSNVSIVNSMGWKGTVFLTIGHIFHSNSRRMVVYLLRAVSGQSLRFFCSHSRCQSSLERHSRHCRNILNSKFQPSPSRRPNAYLVGAQIKFCRDSHIT